MKKVLVILLIIALGAAAYFALAPKKTQTEVNPEYLNTAYSDIISFVVQGYKCHWDGMSPEDMKLSNVYNYESEFGGFLQKDINADGIEELLIGDDFSDGNYSLYDIYTFDPNTNDPVHLLCGGERDYFVLNGSGIIIEHGSNSAADSFDKYYKLEGTKLVEQNVVEESLMNIKLDKFLRYVAPTAFIAVKDGELLGQLVRTLEDTYELEVQDSYEVPKEGVEIQLWSAFDGKGVVFPKNIGTYSIFEAADEDSTPIGETVYEEGEVPETYKCLGYTPGWFRISYNNKDGYLPEAVSEWDFADRF